MNNLPLLPPTLSPQQLDFHQQQQQQQQPYNHYQQQHILSHHTNKIKNNNNLSSLSSSSNSLNLNNSTKTIRHQQSKLDLIDDTTLTSLPLPPPPPIKRTSTSSGASSLKASSSTLLHVRRNLHDTLKSHSDKEQVELENKDVERDDDDEEEGEEEDVEYIDEESQDPIVLVEDYIPRKSSGPHMSRQKSLADFKQRILCPDSMSEMSSIIYEDEDEDFPSSSFRSNNKRSNSSDDRQFTKFEDLEAIFGKIPGSDLLKYCDLCEKPLYEISSIINNRKKRVKRNHHEFVCGDCTENYEVFINEYDVQSNDSSSRCSSSSNNNISSNELLDDVDEASKEGRRNRLLRIFNSVLSKYDLTKGYKKSSDLIKVSNVD